MKTLIATLSLFAVLPQAHAADGATPVPLELRAVVSRDTPGASRHVMKGTDGDEEVFVGTVVPVDASTVERAFAFVDGTPPRARIAIRLTPKGQSAFSAYTEKHVGQRIAIITNGTLLTAPSIHAPIYGATLQITGNFTYERAQEIARSIKPDSK